MVASSISPYEWSYLLDRVVRHRYFVQDLVGRGFNQITSKTRFIHFFPAVVGHFYLHSEHLHLHQQLHIELPIILRFRIDSLDLEIQELCNCLYYILDNMSCNRN